MLSFDYTKDLLNLQWVIIAIDEFIGNTGNEKYQAILTDLKNGIVLDILSDRRINHLISYVKRFERSNRLQVKYFVSDMWKPYAELVPNLQIHILKMQRLLLISIIISDK